MRLVSGYLSALLLVFINIPEYTLMGRRNETSIECALVGDLAFEFHSNKYNTSLTIAECYFLSKSCFMMTTTPENMYIVLNTGRGGVLTITSIDEETIGTYRCYETYNPMNFVSTNIALSQMVSTEETVIEYAVETTVDCSTKKCGHIVLGKLEEKSIECSSNVDISFKFISKNSNETVTIAECYLTVKSCYIMTKSLHDKYTLSHTVHGVTLQMNNLDDETTGTYTCCETYNPLNFVSFDIIAYYMDETDNTTYHITTVTQNTTDNHLGKSGTTNVSESWTIVLRIIAMVIAGLICLLAVSKKVVSCTDFKSTKKAQKFQKLLRRCGNGVVTKRFLLQFWKRSHYKRRRHKMYDKKEFRQRHPKGTHEKETKRTLLASSSKDTDKQVDTCKEDIDDLIDLHERDICLHTEKPKHDNDVNAPKCKFSVSVDIHSHDIGKHADPSIRIINERLGNTTFAEENYEQCCKDFQRRLVEHYNDNSINVPFAALDQTSHKYITDIYATPNIHRIDIDTDWKDAKQEKCLAYKQLFDTDGYSNRRIYVQGEAGSGKTTFAAKLVHDWSYKNQPSYSATSDNTAFDDVLTLPFDDVLTLQKFKFLFFITSRERVGQEDVMQIIKTQLIDKLFTDDDRDGVYKLFLQIIKTELCLVVIDGLDEWIAPVGSDLDEPSVAGFPNDTCVVLTTTRPWKLAEKRINNCQIDILLRLRAFSMIHTQLVPWYYGA